MQTIERGSNSNEGKKDRQKKNTHDRKDELNMFNINTYIAAVGF